MDPTYITAGLGSFVGSFWGVVAVLWWVRRVIERKAANDLCLLCNRYNTKDGA